MIALRCMHIHRGTLMKNGFSQKIKHLGVILGLTTLASGCQSAFDKEISKKADDLSDTLDRNPAALDIKTKGKRTTRRVDNKIFHGDKSMTIVVGDYFVDNEGVNIRKLLKNNPNIKQFEVLLWTEYLLTHNNQINNVISRETLEVALSANELACKKANLRDKIEIYLTNSPSANIYFDHNKQNVVINLGLLTGFDQDSYTRRDLVNAIFHEVLGHGTEKREGIPFSHSPSHERRADSLGVLGTRDYIGVAKDMLNSLILNYELPDETLYPQYINRIKMAVRMFAYDKDLSPTQRSSKLQELQQINQHIHTKTHVKFDLLEYYNEEFAKAHDSHKIGAVQLPDDKMQSLANAALNGKSTSISVSLGGESTDSALQRTDHLMNNGKPTSPQPRGRFS